MQDNTKKILSDLYGLMMEINFHRPSDEVLSELNAIPNARVDKHFMKIKQLSSKYKALANKQYFTKAYEQIQALKSKGLEELKKLIKPSEREELIPLFRKFEEITEKDEASIFEDQELLFLIEVLKARVNDSDDKSGTRS